jgi:NAD(P)-dependent dehydrogenase (short-subunit alcohol dehydrogenase family)
MQNALVIGASRGLGLALVSEFLKRDWDVVATVRGEQTGLHDVAKTSNGRLSVERLDITDQNETAALHDRLGGRQFDLLFVNAGISLEPEKTIAEISTEAFTQIMLTNTLAPMRVIHALDDLVTPNGTIGVMSSGLGSVSRNETGGWETYRASKAGLNTLMRSYAARHRDDARSLLIIAPGWVRTDMGGEQAPLTIDDSIPGVVDTITSHAGQSGLRYLDYRGTTVPW